MSNTKQEIERLNNKLQEITSDKVLIVHYSEENGVKQIDNIVEFSKRYFVTKKTGVLSKSGIRFIQDYIKDSSDFSLVEFEQVNNSMPY